MRPSLLNSTLMSKRRRPSEYDSDDAQSRSSTPDSLQRTRRRVKDTPRARNPPTRTQKPTTDATRNASLRCPHPISLHVLTDVDAHEMRTALLAWFAGVHDLRCMPWRKAYNPALGPEERAQRAYEVWVSEVMLQQTQVTTVIPYYNRWMETFPTIRHLAAADIESINAIWKGLGYYSRAARLLAGAQKAVKELDGRLPANAQEMQAKIPGIGRYSAGAICSIAYGECVPVLDGNVHRLLSRLLALHAPPKAKRTLDVLWEAATAFVQGTDVSGDVNQALIELGSTVCRPRQPACEMCPLRPWCRAYKRHSPAAGPIVLEEEQSQIDIEDMCTLCVPFAAEAVDHVTLYPIKATRTKAREELDAVNVIEWCTHDALSRFFMLVRRPEGGLLAGLHEFLTVPNLSGVRAASAGNADFVGDVIRDWLVPPLSTTSMDASGLEVRASDTGGALYIKDIRPAGDVLHVFSHIRKTYRVYWVVLMGGGAEPPALQSKPNFTAGSRDGSAKGARSRTTKKKKRQNSETETSEEVVDLSVSGTPVPAVRWVPLAEVEGSNIGTGTLKVWRLAKTLWEDSSQP